MEIEESNVNWRILETLEIVWLYNSKAGSNLAAWGASFFCPDNHQNAFLSKSTLLLCYEHKFMCITRSIRKLCSCPKISNICTRLYQTASLYTFKLRNIFFIYLFTFTTKLLQFKHFNCSIVTLETSRPWISLFRIRIRCKLARVFQSNARFVNLKEKIFIERFFFANIDE